MSLEFLLDSNVLSEPLRSRPNSRVMERLVRYEREIATSTTVWQELLFGCERLPQSRKRQQIETYLASKVLTKIPILPYDFQAAMWHAQERSRLVSMERTPAFADSQIAAVAKVNNLILVTNNVSDYENFADLQIQDWFLDEPRIELL